MNLFTGGPIGTPGGPAGAPSTGESFSRKPLRIACFFSIMGLSESDAME